MKRERKESVALREGGAKPFPPSAKSIAYIHGVDNHAIYLPNNDKFES